jgi:DNA-directed RNA polymerase alpha subunit
MKIHVEFNSVAEMVNFSKFAGNDLVQVPQTEKQKAEETKYKQMYETTLGNLERAYERIRMLDPKGKTMNKTEEDLKADEDKLLRKSVYDLPFAARSLNCLKWENIKTVGQLIQYNANELLKMHNLGKGTLKDIRDVLSQHDLKLKGD